MLSLSLSATQAALGTFSLLKPLSALFSQAALDSNNPSGVFAGMGLPPMPYGKIITMIYLKVKEQKIACRQCCI